MLRRIEPEEEAFLRRLCGEKHHLGMSRGYIQNGVTHVANGPLRGMERQIRRIDRHKRVADVAAEDDAIGFRTVLAGLEITEKT